MSIGPIYVVTNVAFVERHSISKQTFDDIRLAFTPTEERSSSVQTVGVLHRAKSTIERTITSDMLDGARKGRAQLGGRRIPDLHGPWYFGYLRTPS